MGTEEKTQTKDDECQRAEEEYSDSLLIDNNEEFSETYLKRRTVTAGEYTEVLVEEIGHLDEDTIGIVIDVAEEKFITKCEVSDSWSSDTGFVSFLEKVPVSTDEEVTKEDFRGMIIDLVFNHEMDACGFASEEYEFEVEKLENEAEDVFDENYLDDAGRI